jgi:hypothetical protein
MQELKKNNKIKEDALAHLSDQLLLLTERIQEIERKQSKSCRNIFMKSILLWDLNSSIKWNQLIFNKLFSNSKNICCYYIM